MKSRQILTRLSITGSLNSNTPLCVLLEVADAHGIKYDIQDSTKPGFSSSLLESINKIELPTINGSDNNIEELQHIARFINKHQSWPRSKLIQAYNFLMQFPINNAVEALTKLPQQFVAGLQTPDNPIAVNACILYQICMHHRLCITNHTTLQQLAHAVRLLNTDTNIILRQAKIFLERDAKRLDLINILLLANNEINDNEPEITKNITNYYNTPTYNVSRDGLSLIRQSLTDMRSLQSRIDPGTGPGAVALGAINYSLDLSYAVSPLQEYKILKMTDRNNYQPADRWMAYWYQRNNAIFDLLLTFNPVYPTEFYTTERLAIMAENEGYSTRDITQSDAIELLQLAYVSPTFYEGAWPNLTTTETPIDMDEVDEVIYGELLSYGCMNGSLIPITVKELTEWFEREHNFATPLVNHDVFSSTAIAKLKLILQRVPNYRRQISANEETMGRRQRLIRVIETIENQTRFTDDPTKRLIMHYRNASATTKVAMITCLTELMHLSMYMRGWNGISTLTYPIKTAPAIEQVKISINVSEAMARYDSAITSLGTIGKFINDLPLVRYRNDQYHVSTTTHDGYTIGARLAIVKGGESIGNIASCIRLSSNWLCSSAYKYLTALGIKQSFDIFHLAHIS